MSRDQSSDHQYPRENDGSESRYELHASGALIIWNIKDGQRQIECVYGPNAWLSVSDKRM